MSRKSIALILALLFVGFNFSVNIYPYLKGRAGWFSQIEDHPRLEEREGVSFRHIELVNTEDPDIQYLANGLQYWLTGSYDYVHHPGTPIIVANSIVAEALYRMEGGGLTRAEFASGILRSPFSYTIACRLVMAFFFALVLVFACLLIGVMGGGGYGQAAGVFLIGSTLLFHRHWLKQSPDVIFVSLNLLIFLLLARLTPGRLRGYAFALSALIASALVVKLSNMVMIPIVLFGMPYMLYGMEGARGPGPRGRTAGLVLWGLVFLAGAFLFDRAGIIGRHHAFIGAASVLVAALVLRRRISQLNLSPFAHALDPAVPATAVLAALGTGALFLAFGLFENPNFIDFYGSIMRPLDDVREIYYTKLHFDRGYFLRTVILAQPFLLLLGIFSFFALPRGRRLKWLIGPYGLIFFVLALVMRPNYHYLLPTMLASSVLAGAAFGAVRGRGALGLMMLLMLLAGAVSIHANVRLLEERLDYLDATRIDRETFEGSDWGVNRHLYGFSTSLYNEEGLPVAGHYGFYPYEVILKRHASVPLSLPNFYTVREDAGGIRDVLERCFERDLLVLTDEVYASAGQGLDADCGLTVASKKGYVEVRPSPAATELVTQVDFSKGTRLLVRGEADDFAMIADERTLGFQMGYRSWRTSIGSWAGEFPVAEKVLERPVEIDGETFLRWKQVDKSEALIITLSVEVDGLGGVPVSYSFNSVSEWEDAEALNIIAFGNPWSMHGPASEYTFQRRLRADLEKAVPGAEGRGARVTAVRVAHRIYTRIDHHRPDRDIGGYVRDMEFRRIGPRAADKSGNRGGGR